MSAFERFQPSIDAERIPHGDIPVIDFSRFRTGNETSKRQAAADIGRACREVGFFYISNHGVSQELVDAAFVESAKFFDLPIAQKRKVGVETSPAKKSGWYRTTPERDIEDGKPPRNLLKEGFRGGALPNDHPLVIAKAPLTVWNPWPTEPSNFQPVIEEYCLAMRKLSRSLLHAFALALEIEESYFDQWWKHAQATFHILHYPASDGAASGTHAHTDVNCFTILAQDDKGGLEVENVDGRWVSATPIPGTFIVNVGDMLTRWTNDLFASTLHRVLNASDRSRYSIPFFFTPDYDSPLKCVPSCLRSGERPKYETISVQECMEQGLAKFADQYGDWQSAYSPQPPGD